MDNKIKYIDLNGLKVFAESLKQDLKNHVIELGLYQELLHRIENLELYKIVDCLFWEYFAFNNIEDLCSNKN